MSQATQTHYDGKLQRLATFDLSKALSTRMKILTAICDSSRMHFECPDRVRARSIYRAHTVGMAALVGLWLCWIHTRRCQCYRTFTARLLALSERLQFLGFIFRSPTPTFVKITSGQIYQLPHFLIFLPRIFNLDRSSFAHSVYVVSQDFRVFEARYCNA